MTLPDPIYTNLSLPPIGLMQVEQRMEQFNRAYVHALASAAGYGTAKPEPDDDSIDLMIKSRAKHGRIKSPVVDLQLKCTANNEIRENQLIFDLEIKNYNDLRDTDVSNPRLLVVMVVPDISDGWISCDETGISLQKRAYYYSLYGMKAVNNIRTVRIKIPVQNVFDVNALHSIMNRIGLSVQL